MKRNDATQAQIDAARPERSTWVSANAGSGKTRVLTDRVARLLLEGVEPQHILCLTYTKAAASEMQNRLFKRLGAWAMKPNDDLRAQLEDLGVEGGVSDMTLRSARRLFARAIETPGGLKIQTIHSFCASILRRFPLEARVTPQFTEMDERSSKLLCSEVIEGFDGTEHSAILQETASYLSDEDFSALTADILKRKAFFATPLSETDLSEVFSISPDLTQADLQKEVFIGGEDALFQELIGALRLGSSTDVTAAEVLADVDIQGPQALEQLEGQFLFKSGDNAGKARIGKFPTKATQKRIPHLLPKIEDLMRRVEDTRPKRIALEAYQKTRTLHRFADAFLPAYEAAKTARGWLDFDDLILRTRDLLSDRLVAEWVLFRLDGGIDHILVDEAQDTSPEQWEVIEHLAREFTSGEGARPEAKRTIFVVGDKKQSIYSFQGADPSAFDRMKADFSDRFAAIQDPLVDTTLAYSFRSAPAILSLVDETFKTDMVSGFSPDEAHKAFHTQMPGRVDLWPVVESPETPDDPDWYDPVDVLAANDAAIVLARQVAKDIKSLVQTGSLPVDETGEKFRPITEGDIMILLPRRSILFHEVIRACKQEGLEIAGADRLKIGGEQAVRDITALLSFLSLAEDDYALACALKSPLFGWDEQDLFGLAHDRGKASLWQALREKTRKYGETVSILQDLRDRADFFRPYELIERILTVHDGRRKLLSRLGPEAEDGIDALLDQALIYETRSVPNLTGFLVWLASDEVEIKRQMDSAGNRIRVMTVHGAKGLEAPIVYLPDCGARPPQIRDHIVIQDGIPLWKTRANATPPAIRAAVDGLKDRAEAERNRLLYVAMTRAEKWLIVGATGKKNEMASRWHGKIEKAMTEMGAAPLDVDGLGTGLRIETGQWTGPRVEPATQAEQLTLTALPGYFDRPAPVVSPLAKTISPSDLEGPKALTGPDGLEADAAMRRGSQIHLLLEHLPNFPEEDRAAIAELLLKNEPFLTTSQECADLLSEVTPILTSEDLRFIFASDTLSEVPITANLAELCNRRLHGVIDRLVLTDTAALIVDFKTNAVVPKHPKDTPSGILAQMGAYAAALSQIMPDRQIETAILWTRNASFMRLPNPLIFDALGNIRVA